MEHGVPAVELNTDNTDLSGASTAVYAFIDGNGVMMSGLNVEPALLQQISRSLR